MFARHLKLADDGLRASAEAGENEAGIRAVAENPDAIVYISVGEAERAVRRGTPIKPLPLQQVASTIRNVRSNYYPLSRPLTLVTRGVPSGAAKQFLDFAMSSQVTDLIREYSFVPYLD